MNRSEVRPHVEAVFAAPRSRTTRVAVEQEHFAVDLLHGGTASPDRVRTATAGRPCARVLSFEPGGQVELSLDPVANPAALAQSLISTTGAVAADLAPHGIALVAAPVSLIDASRRHLHSPRYDAMERHFDSIGPAGRRMMRATASTQVCLDWWPGTAGTEQYELLLLAGPFLAAALCTSSRLATWLQVDPARTAFDDRLLHGDCRLQAYVDFAAGATAFVDGAAEHVTTLFPPVRPRGGYLEVRFPDARPADEVGPLVAGLAGLLYDDERRRAALDALRGERRRQAEHWASAAAGELDPELGHRLLGGRVAEAVAA